MSYFSKLISFNTYEGHDSNFHYDYNANSGGGQAFLGGSFNGYEGKLHSGKDLEGKTASFVFRFHDASGFEHHVDLGSDELAKMDVIPRGAGSQNMKLSLEKKKRPSLLFPALLMLPRTCGRNMAESLKKSPLTLENYWLRSMWLDVEIVDNDSVRFIPKDYVFEGGCTKKKGVSDGKTVIGEPVFFSLDYELRANDILRAASHSSKLPNNIAAIVQHFKHLLLGDEAFSYSKCDQMVEELMAEMANHYPELYSGISDPLPTLMRLADYSACKSRPKAKVKIIDKPRNYIFFGAPGTGKSYTLNKLAVGTDSEPGLFAKDHVTRVTFHPDYSYSQFVGCFKPYSEPDTKKISYKFVEGPFLKTYLEAIAHPYENYALLIEEINRANPAAVFGDVFQLLDRNRDGNSIYPVATSKEMADRISDYFDELEDKDAVKDAIERYYDPDLDFGAFCEMSREGLCLPPNMYIWATMNSADQGVFPMDTAFKRRWDFHYIDIDEGADADINGVKLSDIEVPCGKFTVKWNDLRMAINDFLLSDDIHVNEDKLLGPFFISPESLDPKTFAQVFMDKVLLYLYEDAGKTKRTKLFRSDLKTYSQVCEAFREEGAAIFSTGFPKLEYCPEPETDTANGPQK